jgi:ribonuclease D
MEAEQSPAPKAHPNLLSTPAEIAELAQVLSRHTQIAFDTEFIRENTFFPIVEIIQVATDQESWLIDAAAFKKGYRAGPGLDGREFYHPGLDPLLEVFKNKNILKIVHAAQGDQECLYTSFGITASPTLDTSVAASLCGYGEAVGLGKLLKSVLGITIDKGHARTNWSVRPLPQQLLEYAHADVLHLVELGNKLMAQVEKRGRKDWALELSAKWEDHANYETDIEDLAQKLARGGRLDHRGHAALVELLKWRESRVRYLNLPRRWVADDTVLMDLARVRPKDIDHLASFRGLNKGELKHSGDAILTALKAASEIQNGPKLPPSRRVEAPTTEESQLIDLLRCFVGILADRHRIAARHLMTTPQFLALIREEIKTSDDLVKTGVLSSSAASLIGDEIVAFLHGRRALTVRDRVIEVVDSSKALESGGA